MDTGPEIRCAPIPAVTTNATPVTCQRSGVWRSTISPSTVAMPGSNAISVPKAGIDMRRSASISRDNGSSGNRIARPRPCSAMVGVKPWMTATAPNGATTIAAVVNEMASPCNPSTAAPTRWVRRM